MLSYTGHPFLDVGLAVITVFSEKERPEYLTQDDLVKMADFIKENYYVPYLISYLHSTIIPNNRYFQKVNCEKQNKKVNFDELNQFYNTYLYGYLHTAREVNRKCVFFNKPAIALASKDHIPLLTGKDYPNFMANGQLGLAISPEAALCFQSLALGTLKCNGKALLIHSNDYDIVQDLAKIHLDEHRKLISLSSDEIIELHNPKTILLEHLTRIYRTNYNKIQKNNSSVTIYNFINYNTNADIEIYHLPMEQVKFLKRAVGAKYCDIWDKIVNKSLKVEKRKTKKSKTEYESRKRQIYEDMFDLPDNASKFIRTYFLRKSIKEDIELINWDITALLLEEILKMEKERIEIIKNFADKIAKYILKTENGKKIFKLFFNKNSYYKFKDSLISLLLKSTKDEGGLLFNFDEFTNIFEISEDWEKKDWSLSKDLIAIRLIEQLYENGWFSKNDNKEIIENEELEIEE